MSIGMNKSNGYVQEGEFLTGDMSFISVFSALPLGSTGVNLSVEDLKRNNFMNPSYTTSSTPGVANVWTVTITGPATSMGSFAATRIKIDGVNYSGFSATIMIPDQYTANEIATDLAAEIELHPVVESTSVVGGDIIITFEPTSAHEVTVSTSTAYGITQTATETTPFAPASTSTDEIEKFVDIPLSIRTINGVEYNTLEEYNGAYYRQYNLNMLVKIIENLTTPVILTKPLEFTKTDTEVVRNIHGDIIFGAAGEYVSSLLFATEHVSALGSIKSTGELNFDVLLPQLVGQTLLDHEGNKYTLREIDIVDTGLLHMFVSDSMLIPGRIENR